MSSNERSVILCTAGFDHTIRFWEAPTGLCHRTLQYTDSQVNRLELTPDKQYLGVGGNPHVRLYETNNSNQNPITSFDGHTNNVTAIGFQKDRKWMYTGSEDGTVKIWDIRAPGYQRDYHSRAGVNTVSLHPNQAELICGDEDGVIRVWDLTANKCVSELVPDGRVAIRSLCISSDASLLVCGNNKGSVFSWRIGSRNSTFEALPRIDAHNNYLLKCLLSPDVRLLATCSADKTIKLWNIEGINENRSLNNDNEKSTTQSKLPSSPSSSQSGQASQGSANSNSPTDASTRDSHISLDKTLSAHTSWVWDMTFSADSAYLVSASSDKTAKLWDVKSAEVILEYKGHHKAITAVALNDAS